MYRCVPIISHNECVYIVTQRNSINLQYIYVCTWRYEIVPVTNTTDKMQLNAHSKYYTLRMKGICVS